MQRPGVEPTGGAAHRRTIESESGRAAPSAVSTSGIATWVAAVTAAASLFTSPIVLGRRIVDKSLVRFMPDLYETITATAGASQRGQLVGAWSRLGLYHPGPAWFYWAAPFLSAAGHQPSGPFFAALALVGVCGAAIAGLVMRHWGPVHGVVAAVVLAVAYHQVSLVGLSHPWNPTVLILPVALGLMCSGASIATGSRPVAGLGAVAGAFVAQAHLGAVPLGGAIIAACVIGPVVTRWRHGTLRERWWAWLLVVLAAALPWLPVFADQLGRSGNLSTVATYLATGEVDEQFPPTPLGTSLSLSRGEVVTHVAAMTSLVEADAAIWGGADVTGGLEHTPSAWSVVVVIGLVVACGAGAAATRISWLAVPSSTTWICRAALVGLLLELVAGMAARDEFRYYLVAGATGVGVALWLGAALIAVTVVARVGRQRRPGALPVLRPVASVVGLVSVWGMAAAAGVFSSYPGFEMRIDHDQPAVIELLAQHPEGGFSIEADRMGDLLIQGPLVTSLDHHGRRVQVTGPFAAHFSDHNRHASGGPQIHVVRPGDRVPEDCAPLGIYDVPIGNQADMPICVSERGT